MSKLCLRYPRTHLSPSTSGDHPNLHLYIHHSIIMILSSHLIDAPTKWLSDLHSTFTSPNGPVYPLHQRAIY